MALFAGEMREMPDPGFANLSDRGAREGRRAAWSAEGPIGAAAPGISDGPGRDPAGGRGVPAEVRVFKQRRVTRKGVRSRMTWLERRKTGTCVRDTITMGFLGDV